MIGALKAPRVRIDFETFSELDVKDVGPIAYASHPSTEVMVLGYQINDQEPKLWFPHLNKNFPYDLHVALSNLNTVVVAHNAMFEWAMWRYCLRVKYPQHFNYIPYLEHHRFSCTAARARRLALPGKLEQLCFALKLRHQKDMEGHRLMLKMCKPKKPSKKDPSTRHNKPEQYKRLGEYCKKDLLAEAEVDKLLPELPAYERKVWLLDQKINERGVKIDLKSCLTIRKLAREYQARLKKELVEITRGEVLTVNQTARIKRFCMSRGLLIKSVAKDKVDKILSQKNVDPIAKRVLEIRLALGKSSVSKYDSLIARVDKVDHRVRDLWVYHTASTGRWGGSGPQPQNFPRGVFKDPKHIDTALWLANTGDLDLFIKFYPNPMVIFSSLLRSMFIADDGERFFTADYAGIELRVLMWLVGQKNALMMIERGGDLYCDQATDIFGKPINKVDHPFERFVGKEAVLGMGYQMGAPKFMMSVNLKSPHAPIDLPLAKRAVKSYRKKFNKVAAFWKDVENAAIKCVISKQPVVCGKVRFSMEGIFLKCHLPSGRELSYAYPSVRNKMTHWGEVKPMLHYWGIGSKNKKWSQQTIYGGKWTENIVQALARDIMTNGAFACEKKRYRIQLTVHDELATAKKINANGSVKELQTLMCTLPQWAKGCPITAEGWEGPRYRK